ENQFSNHHQIAMENRYGMHFYTKLKTREIKEHFLISDETASTEALLEDDDASRFELWGIHSARPTPTDTPTSTQNHPAWITLAKLSRDTEYPSIVVGDFNDGCWSRSSRLCAKVSKLKDVRKGRGVLGTFPVRPSIFRFPLDLIFCSKEIQVKAIKILSDIGSDHLPLFSKITVSSSNATNERELDSDLEEEIDEIIKEGRKEAYKE